MNETELAYHIGLGNTVFENQNVVPDLMPLSLYRVVRMVVEKVL